MLRPRQLSWARAKFPPRWRSSFFATLESPRVHVVFFGSCVHCPLSSVRCAVFCSRFLLFLFLLLHFLIRILLFNLLLNSSSSPSHSPPAPPAPHSLFILAARALSSTTASILPSPPSVGAAPRRCGPRGVSGLAGACDFSVPSLLRSSSITFAAPRSPVFSKRWKPATTGSLLFRPLVLEACGGRWPPALREVVAWVSTESRDLCGVLVRCQRI